MNSEHEKRASEAAAQTDDALIARLRAGAQGFVDGCVDMAYPLVELERRGRVFGQDIPFLHFLRNIGRGRLLPEAFRKFFQKVDVLRRLCKLSLEQQQVFVDDQEIEVAMLDAADGKDSYRQKPSTMLPATLDLVLDETGIRTKEQQFPVLRQRRGPKPIPLSIPDLRVSRKPPGVFIAAGVERFIPEEVMKAALLAISR